MIKRILVPVDGSKHSGKALKLAVDVAEKYGAKLSVLFVASRKTSEKLQAYIDHELNRNNDLGITAISEQIGKRTIKAITKNIKTNVVIKRVVLIGDPAEQIVKYSNKNNFDMVFMGNRGLSDIEGVMMGSVSRKVRRLVKCTFVSIK